MDNTQELLKEYEERIAQLLRDNEALQKTNDQLLEQTRELNQNVANLTETVEYLTRKLFGKSREKTEDPNQLNFFNEAEVTADEASPEPSVEEVKGYQRERKPKSTRKDSYDGLPAREVLCELSRKDRICPLCGIRENIMMKIQNAEKTFQQQIKHSPEASLFRYRQSDRIRF